METLEKTKNKILIVDDMEINREILAAILEDRYECFEAENGAKAFEQVKEHFHDLSLILLDLMMPEVDGFMFLKLLKDADITHIPVIIITANSDLEQEKRAFALGAVDFIPKPFDTDIVRYRVDTHVKLKLYQNHLEDMIEENVEKMAEAWTSVTQAMAEIVESRNYESGQHVKRTGLLTKMILTELTQTPKIGYYCSPKERRYIYEAASLHDIGKIAIPDHILLKPGRLTDEEFKVMQTHTTLGYEMAKKITHYATPEYEKFCCQIAFCHHEKWDGTGYPNRFKGEEIPLAARVVAIADTYDAITNTRPYRIGKPHEEAVAEIRKMSGSQFDPYLVEAFLRIENSIKTTFAALENNTI